MPRAQETQARRKTMPKSKGGVRKECESCDQQIPVACKTCPECRYPKMSHKSKSEKKERSHDSVSEKDKRDEASPDTSEVDSNTDQMERRRSVRAKRDKPDYYDALDFESKRQKTPRSEKKKGSGVTPRSPATAAVKARRQAAINSQQQAHTRATLTWKKGSSREEEGGGGGAKESGSGGGGGGGGGAGETGKKKGKKGGGGGGGHQAAPAKKDDFEESLEPVLEDIPTEKVFNCAVSLAEINRKLGIVMWRP